MVSPLYMLATKLFAGAKARFENLGLAIEAEDAEAERYAAEEMCANCGEVIGSMGSLLPYFLRVHAHFKGISENDDREIGRAATYLHRTHPGMPDFAMQVLEDILSRTADRGTNSLVDEYEERLLDSLSPSELILLLQARRFYQATSSEDVPFMFDDDP